MTTTLITGANSGIGFETARALASHGHGLIITSRSLDSAQQAAQRIREETGTAVVHPLALDLNSFASIRDFAQQATAVFPVLDVALFNAGVMIPPYALTGDGFETQFQANYLGHFALYQLLRPSLLAAAAPKVISVSSLSSERGTCDTVDCFAALARVNEADYEPMASYRESKLAQILFTVALDRRDGPHGLRSYAVHPGVVNTDLFYRGRSSLFKAVARPLAWLGTVTGRLKTAAQGAETSVYLAANDILPSGEYWADEAVRPMNPIARDESLAHGLWVWSDTIVANGKSAGVE
jgi:NAD(P)-dependent dehydrogenase (short-subunit alcohol dehydrogenase family)